MEPAEELRILQQMCHAFASSDNVEEATTSAVGWVRTLLPDATSIRLFLADEAGRLQLLSSGDDSRTLSRGPRRNAYRRRQPTRIALGNGEVRALLPIVARGTAFGVLELTAPEVAVDDRWGSLQAAASQTAIAIRNIRIASDLVSSVETLHGSAALIRDLVTAGSRRLAVRAGLRFSAKRFGRPVVAWVVEADSEQLELVGARNVSGDARSGIELSLASVPRWEAASEPERSFVRAEFAAATGEEEVAVVDAGDGLLIVADGSPGVEARLDVIRVLLRSALERIGEVERSLDRSTRLATGLAWTAHEVREPLLAARMVMEALAEGEPSGRRSDLLERATEELAELSSTVNDLLRWATGEAPLRRRRVDVMQVVEEALAFSASDEDRNRFAITETTAKAPVLADRVHLRSALSNVLRNALSYSPEEEQIGIAVRDVNGSVRICVTDHGPGVAPEEREAVFEPFVRGRTAGSRTGRGLGLFIARRVVEAHGGRIWLDSHQEGSTVTMELPVEAQSELPLG